MLPINSRRLPAIGEELAMTTDNSGSTDFILNTK